MDRNIEEKLTGIKKNVELAPYTTFKIGGPADYFLEVKEKEDLIKAIKTAKEFKLPFFVLGNGSNLLISDKGFRGLVMKINFSDVETLDSEIKCGAGVLLGRLVDMSTKLNFSGSEWAAGIPGTVGGAVRGNAGAFDGSMEDMVKEVEVLDISTEAEIKKYSKRDCEFDYRDSIFKRRTDLIILSIVFHLERGEQKEIKESIARYLNYRRERHPLEFSSAGSIFKNPENFSAAKLIYKCELAGKKIGQAQISEKHTNFIVNLGGAKAIDVIELINLAKQEVKNEYGVELQEEIQLLGF